MQQRIDVTKVSPRRLSGAGLQRAWAGRPDLGRGHRAGDV